MQRRQRLIGLAVSIVVAAAALTAGAFVVGSHNPAVAVASGNASVGDGVVTAFVDGVSYEIPQDVAWVGSDGSWRPDGTPACVAWTGSSRVVAIQFGWVPIKSPDGNGWRQVVWVNCRN